MALAAIMFMLWMAVRSPRLIAAILVTMLIGLVVAMACGLLIFGRFNVISVAFIPLFRRPGYRFPGIQFTVRFRSETSQASAYERRFGGGGRRHGPVPRSWRRSPLRPEFLAFAPTAYLGVSQLGVIAGVGMLLAVALNLTFLPVLILVLQPPSSDTGAAERQVGGAWIVSFSHASPAGARQCAGRGHDLPAPAAVPCISISIPSTLENTQSEAVSTTLDPDAGS